MKIKEGFTLPQICGENVTIASGKQDIDISKLIRLNFTAAMMWKVARESGEFTAETIADRMVERTGVAPEVTLAEVREALNEWKIIGFVN